MRNQYLLLIKEEVTNGPAYQQAYDANKCLNVRDLSTRLATQVLAQDISLYRHTLFLGDKAYQILNQAIISIRRLDKHLRLIIRINP